MLADPEKWVPYVMKRAAAIKRYKSKYPTTIPDRYRAIEQLI